MDPLSLQVAWTINDTARALYFVSETTNDRESPFLGHLVHPFVHPSLPGSPLIREPATYPQSMAAIGLEFAAGLSGRLAEIVEGFLGCWCSCIWK
jgi:hypothetical protein